MSKIFFEIPKVFNGDVPQVSDTDLKKAYYKAQKFSDEIKELEDYNDLFKLCSGAVLFGTEHIVKEMIAARIYFQVCNLYLQTNLGYEYEGSDCNCPIVSGYNLIKTCADDLEITIESAGDAFDVRLEEHFMQCGCLFVHRLSDLPKIYGRDGKIINNILYTRAIHQKFTVVTIDESLEEFVQENGVSDNTLMLLKSYLNVEFPKEVAK